MSECSKFKVKIPSWNQVTSFEQISQTVLLNTGGGESVFVCQISQTWHNYVQNWTILLQKNEACVA